ncbi:MAG: c-type cytochrome [Deltaproteobacteria bacterium]
MKARKVLGIVAGIGILAAVPAMAQDHQVPTAPGEYLDMKNPLKESKDVIEKGEKIYMKKCKKCHGEKGDGKGSAAEGFKIAPTAFIAPGLLKGKKDGQLFFITEKGSPNTDMEGFGEGSETNLPKNDIWSVITYIRKTFTK